MNKPDPFVTAAERRLIQSIAQRALVSYPHRVTVIDRTTIEFALIACHAYAARLDLRMLLIAPPQVFERDVFGILANTDAEDGGLVNGFLPLCIPERTLGGAR